MAVIIAASAAKSVFRHYIRFCCQIRFALFSPCFVSVFLPGSRVNPAGGFYFNIFTASDIRGGYKDMDKLLIIGRFQPSFQMFFGMPSRIINGRERRSKVLLALSAPLLKLSG